MESRHREDATLDTNKAPKAVLQSGSDEGQSTTITALDPQELATHKSAITA